MKPIEKKKELKINGKTITVKKLPLRKIIGLLSEIEKLPQEIVNIDKMSSDKIMESLPVMIVGIMPTVASLVVRAVDDPIVTEDFLLDECYFDDSVELIAAILEVNNFGGIMVNIKKIRGLRNPQVQAAKA